MHSYSPLFVVLLFLSAPLLFLFVCIALFYFFCTCVSVRRRDRCTRTPFTPPFCLGFWASRLNCFCTCVSVHRRDRCTRTLPFLLCYSSFLLPFSFSLCALPSFTSFVPVCLSADVTGALVPLSPPFLFSFWASRLNCFCTCVSVHRRDRCTRTFPFH